MVRSEVPYKVVGGTKFYDRKEVKDVLAYLRVLVNPDDEVSWRRIVNVPKRGWATPRWPSCPGSPASAGCPSARRWPRPARPGSAARRAGPGGTGRPARRPARPDGRARPGRRRRGALAPGPSPSWPVAARGGPRRRDGGARRFSARASWSTAVVERTGYRSELLAEGTIEALGRVENVDELVGVADEYRTLTEFLEAASLVADSDQLDGDGTSVSLMTHAHRQGPRVPGGVPGRDGGRDLPPPALPRRPGRARGGAPALLRRDHPGRAPPLPLPRLEPDAVGQRPAPTSRAGSSTRSPPSWSATWPSSAAGAVGGTGSVRGRARSVAGRRQDRQGTPGRSVFGSGVSPPEGDVDANGRHRRAAGDDRGRAARPRWSATWWSTASGARAGWSRPPATATTPRPRSSSPRSGARSSCCAWRRSSGPEPSPRVGATSLASVPSRRLRGPAPASDAVRRSHTTRRVGRHITAPEALLRLPRSHRR